MKSLFRSNTKYKTKQYSHKHYSGTKEVFDSKSRKYHASYDSYYKLLTVSPFTSEKKYNIRTKEKSHVQIAIFSPDDKYFVYLGKNYYINIWNINSGNHYKTITTNSGTNFTNIKFSSNGKYLFCSDNKGYIKKYDFNTMKLISSIKITDDYIKEFDISSTNDFLFLEINGGKKIIYNLVEKKITYIYEDKGFNIKISPDNKFAVYSSDDLKIFDIKNKILYTYPTFESYIQSLDWSSDGKYLLTSNSKTVNIWDTRRLHTSEVEYNEYLSALKGNVNQMNTFLTKYPKSLFFNEVEMIENKTTMQNEKNKQINENSKKEKWKLGNDICCLHNEQIIYGQFMQWNEDKSMFMVKIIAGTKSTYADNDIVKNNIFWLPSTDMNWHLCLTDEKNTAIAKQNYSNSDDKNYDVTLDANITELIIDKKCYALLDYERDTFLDLGPYTITATIYDFSARFVTIDVIKIANKSYDQYDLTMYSSEFDEELNFSKGHHVKMSRELFLSIFSYSTPF